MHIIYILITFMLVWITEQHILYNTSLPNGLNLRLVHTTILVRHDAQYLLEFRVSLVAGRGRAPAPPQELQNKLCPEHIQRQFLHPRLAEDDLRVPLVRGAQPERLPRRLEMREESSEAVVLRVALPHSQTRGGERALVGGVEEVVQVALEEQRERQEVGDRGVRRLRV